MFGFLVAIAAAQERMDELSPEHPPGVDLPDAPSAIINGARERGYPSTIGLGAFGFTFCTGSLITPRVVLTAAHCSAGYPIELVVQLGSAYLGTNAATPDAELKFTGAEVHPGYVPLVSGGTLGQNDIAVLFLAEDAPAEPVWFRTEPLRERGAEGAEVISVGYGLDENQEANVKRSATLSVRELDPMFLVSYSADNPNGANICSGDSGGPQYHVEEDGSLLQWAVHSWGDLDCVYQSGSTRTDVVAEWILDQVESEHGSRDRCVIFGNYGDGICQEYCDNIDPDCIERFPPAAEFVASDGGCGCSSGRGALGWLILPLLVVTRRRSAVRSRGPRADSPTGSPGTTSE